MRTSILIFLLCLTNFVSFDVFSQEVIPENAHSKKLQTLVGRTIWYVPRVGCLDRISKQGVNSPTERFMPTQPEKIEIKSLHFDFGYTYEVRSESGFFGKAEANQIEGEISLTPYNATSFYSRCFYDADPDVLKLELQKRDAIGFKVYAGYGTEGRDEAIKKIVDHDKFIDESIRKDNERAKRPSVKIGMTSKQVREQSSWGEPLKVNRATTGRGETEQWVYGDNQYLYFKNGVLTSIQN